MLYRSFIAFELSDETKKYCSMTQKSLNSKGVKGKWTKPENLHITINFMGNRSWEDLLSIAKNIDVLQIDLSCIAFETSGFRVFGSSYKVLTLELSEINGSATQIISNILTANKLKNDQPSWVPHITLARFKNRHEKISLKNVNWEEGFRKVKFSPKGLAVFTSKTTQSGPIYKKIASKWNNEL